MTLIDLITSLLPWATVSPVEGIDSEVYKTLQDTFSFSELHKVLSKHPNDLKDYVRVVKNHNWPLFHYQQLVNDFNVPVLHMSKLKPDKIDPNAIYMIENAITTEMFPIGAHKLFTTTKNFMVFIACEADTGKLPQSYHSMNSVAVVDAFVSKLGHFTNSVVLFDLPTTGSRIQLSDIDLSERTTLSFTNLNDTRVRGSKIRSPVIIDNGPLETLIINDNLQINSDSLHEHMSTCKLLVLGSIDNEDIKSFDNVETLNKTLKPETVSIKDLTMHHRDAIVKIYNVHELKDITFDAVVPEGEGYPFNSLRVSTMPKNFLTSSPDDLIRPIIDGISTKQDSTVLWLDLNVFGLFPMIKNISAPISRLEVTESAVTGFDIFKGFNSEVYGELFSSTEELHWRTNPAPLKLVDGLFSHITCLSVLLKSKEDFDIIQSFESSTIESFAIFVESTDIDIPVPVFPHLKSFSMTFKTPRTSPIKLKNLSKVYPTLIEFNVYTGGFASTLISWYTELYFEGDDHFQDLIKMKLSNEILLDLGSIQDVSFPSLKQLSVSLSERSNTTPFQIRAPSLQTLSLTAFEPESSLELTGFEKLSLVTMTNFNNVRVDDCPSLTQVDVDKSTNLKSLTLAGDVSKLQMIEYATDHGKPSNIIIENGGIVGDYASRTVVSRVC
ncbi:CYFA0S27e00617g1_1 [Cyberlindnera fabianii]|uniref:CYFA0S27e00617g1_1 n=1 Tax=Cyberlindnera fabianii TaxID=36022 RepID=A0A061BJ44_CYBFA|nr:CYFA0S27e00617g1_1 [Cyberlindnera fabianii]